ncbi:DUF4214 domain-containing protein [Cellulomonas xiejunii]|uniref:DUF4214 domain-containing protein n=1 Tax=Cellulomonas xiejunii TaxID=2968083 RepID=UPI001D0E3396|nr:DUF4214 domain-containing protein [Cellulomonas xiejunii]MCC2312902.1 DUF4214 domain-containing protein [Cellulomonas xiejunii]
MPQSLIVSTLALSLAAPLFGTVALPDPTPSATSVEVTGDVVVEEVDLRVVPAAEADAAESQDVIDPATEPVVADAPVDGRVQTPPVDTSAVQTIGVTWPDETDAAGLAPKLRAMTDGTWTAWQDLEVSDVHPDAGGVDAQHALRAGTDSLWIGDAEAVQLSFVATTAGGPDDLRLTLVGSEVPADGVTVPSAYGGADVGTASLTTSSGTRSDRSGARVVNAAVLGQPAAVRAAAAAAPRVISRAEWGARPQQCALDLAAGGLVAAAVHHTAGSNSYASAAQAMQQIRNDQAYHMDARGWCDLGYNFIVDKWGNIYEGRAGSLTQPVIGVHAGGFNTGTVGVSMLGEYGATAPSAATQESVSRIIGYRLGAYGKNPAGTVPYRTLGGENSRFAAGTTVNLPVVFGHRDTAYTACPGNAGYAALPAIRSRAQKIAYSEPLVKALYADMLGRGVDPTGLATWTGLLLSGAPASTLGDNIARSREYASARVAAAYREILRREPDGPGLEDWTTRVMSGRVKIEDLRGWLVSSQEYYQRSGGNDRAFVAQLYRDILRRDAAQSEIDHWVREIARGGRGIVNAGIWRSLESANLRVHEAFDVYLDRRADPTGLATWGPYWQANGEDALRGMIIGSDEYLARSVRLF